MHVAWKAALGAAIALGLGVGLGVKSAQRDRLLPPGD